jgi:hypothetical protein
MSTGARMPLPASNSVGAAMDLGLGGQLNQQATAETEEERRKRMQQLQQQQALGPAGSLAVTSIFGGVGGPGY